MFIRIFQVLCLFCATYLVELSNTDSLYGCLRKIRNDYCKMYFRKQTDANNHSKCEQFMNRIVTNYYELELNNMSSLSVSWKYPGPVNLGSLVQLDSNRNKTNFKLQRITVNQNEHALVPGLQYLIAFGIHKVDIHKDMILQSDGTKIEIMEKSTDIVNGAKHITVLLYNNNKKNISDNLYDYLRQSMRNLHTLQFEGISHETIILRSELFENQMKLAKLCFLYLTIENINIATFEKLTNLKELEFEFVNIKDQTFLSSPTLQSNLEQIVLDIGVKVDLKLFQNYSKLKFILTLPERRISCHNLTAFVCELKKYLIYLGKPKNCNFILGADGRRCPTSCNCSLELLTNRFIINCTGQGFTEVPELPTPITGQPALLFGNNHLSTLPSINLTTGFASLKELHLSNNKLTKLNIDQLPSGLTFLDIGNRKVVKFHSNNIRFRQFENFRISFCDDANLIVYQRIPAGTEEYSDHPDERCPQRCQCCFNETAKRIIIDCRNKNLTIFDELPKKLSVNSALLLDNNQLEYLSQLEKSSLQELHLFNSKLKILPMEKLPPNITYLDIRNNNLVTLDDKVLKFLIDRTEDSRLKIKLSGNPWTCDCESKFFLTFLRKINAEEYNDILRREVELRGDCPQECFCCLDFNTLQLMINCSNRGLSEIPSLPSSTKIKISLLFENNYLESLPNGLIPGYRNLHELHVANNRLKDITQLPNNITYLDIRKNRLRNLRLEITEFLIKISSHVKLFISENPWECSCSEKHFLKFSRTLGDIPDLAYTKCSNLALLSSIEEADVCIPPPDLDKHKKFDGFLAYTHKDSDLVGEYIDRLENGRHKFKICFYERDWLVGEAIPDCICQSIEDSRRTIILMTKSFISSSWGRLEFRKAMQETSKDECKRLIIVVYPDVENFDLLDSELKRYMVLNTYLKRDDSNFWNKLIYAMPHDRLKNDATVF